MSVSKLIGLYWYCSEYYNGMSDWRYQVLSTSKYNPGPMATKDSDLTSDWNASDYYDKLVLKFEGTPVLDTATLSDLDAKDDNGNDIYQYIDSDIEIAELARDYSFNDDDYQYLFILAVEGEIWEIWGTNTMNLNGSADKIYDRKLHFEKIDKLVSARG